MKLWSNQLIGAVAVGMVMGLMGIALEGRAAAQTGKAGPSMRPSAGEFFKNVTTSTLRGLSVDDFLVSMGVISADLGFDCSNCHPGAGSDKVDWVIDTPQKVMARKMVEMMAVINRTNFGGAQMVTCWSCHHGLEIPSTTITLDHLYSAPYDEQGDVIKQAPGKPSAEQILDKYIQALGGAQRLASLTSFIATGNAAGYEKGGKGTFQIFAKAPDQRTTVITFSDGGEGIRAYDGRAGWIKTPRTLLGQYELTGGELDGARMDAQLSFPGQINQVLSNLRSGYSESINDREAEVVQGTGPRGLLVTLYFDKQSGLLVRMVRYSKSPVGRAPTQVEFSDYRDVGGIKFPFKYTFSWLDGRDSFQLSDVKTNVPIDASKFGKPN